MHRERRAAVRRTPAPDEPLCCARLRAGRELTVVDVSDAGALVETTARLLPGTHVEVHVVTREGRTLVRSRVTRAWVHEVTADTLRYRAALAFERRVNSTPGWVVATRNATSGAFPGSVYPNSEASERATEEG
jgi:hypothetical protein